MARQQGAKRSPIQRIHAAIQRQKPNLALRKKALQNQQPFRLIPAEPRQVTGHDAIHSSVMDVPQHGLKRRAVEMDAAVTIIHIHIHQLPTLLHHVIRQPCFLIGNTGALCNTVIPSAHATINPYPINLVLIRFQWFTPPRLDAHEKKPAAGEGQQAFGIDTSRRAYRADFGSRRSGSKSMPLIACSYKKRLISLFSLVL